MVEKTRHKIGVYGVGLSKWWDNEEGGTLAEREVKEEVRTYRVTLSCPACKTGTMEYTGAVWPTGNPGYHHKCDACGEARAVKGGPYPRTRHEPVDGGVREGPSRADHEPAAS